MLLLLAAGFSFLAVWYWLPGRMDTLVLNASESEVATRMEHALRDSSTPYQDIARWMSSDRAAVALEATRLMQARIDRLQAEPGLAIADQAYRLAQALKNELPNYPEQTHYQVHLMADQMANWDLGSSTKQHGPFLILLEDMIRETRPSTPSTELAASDHLVLNYLQTQKTSETTATSPAPIDHRLGDIDLRGGLPWQQQSIPGDAPKTETALPARTQSVHRDVDVLPANRRVAIDQPLKLPILTETPKQLPAGPHPDQPLPDFSRLTTLEIMWMLHLQNSRMVKHARETLIARNFNTEDLELATRLTHPDVAQRLQLVRDLPIMPREDRTHWLYYMTKDPDEGVRYSAAAALLTSTDPRLLRRLKADMATDPSPRVQALIRR
ncbi:MULTISPECIES: hypothetical protein [Pirellulaceae]|nr:MULTISPECIES: hypothetical protein [Pirellulaceae]